jgi:hypothetical protein
MANSFKDLIKNRSQSFNKLNEQLNKLNSKSYESDNEKYWKPEVDKAGNGYAVIRFLDAPKGEDFPWVQLWSHGFQGPTGLWYIENSRTTLGKDVPDPVSEYNTKLWNTGTEDAKEIARKQKRKLHYISNIYVVRDPANPSNEGKVFLFKYGKKIFDKINDLMNPQYEGEVKVNPFDFMEGANFQLKIRKYEGYPNYDKSDFMSPSPLFEDEDMMEKIWESEYSLKDLVDPKNFKSYDELKERFYRVIGLGESNQNDSIVDDDQDDDKVEEYVPSFKEKKATKIAEAASKQSAVDDEDDDDNMSFFQSLANE